MMPPTTTGTSTPVAAQAGQHLGDQVEVAARQDRKSDQVDILVPCHGGDLGGGLADALVDHLEAGVTGGQGDLLGAVAVTVQPGLGHQQPGWAPVARHESPHPGPGRRPVRRARLWLRRLDSGWRPVFAPDLPEGAGPFAGGSAGVGQARWWRASG